MAFSRLAAPLFFLFASVLTGQTSNGSISGVVYDAQTGRPIPGVGVAVNGQSSDRNVTDSDGRFTIPLSPGKYTLRFAAPNYTDVQVADVEVKAAETTEASAVMANKSAVTRIDVVEKATAVGATAEAMLSERKLSPVVSDSMGREELQAGASSDAAGALEKVTGVSVVGEGFVYVRGLGERYSSTMLNSAMIPTTEPEKRVVPLDLFPTGLIENREHPHSEDLHAGLAGRVFRRAGADVHDRVPRHADVQGQHQSGLQHPHDVQPVPDVSGRIVRFLRLRRWQPRNSRRHSGRLPRLSGTVHAAAASGYRTVVFQ
jgi:hypothetical protein